MNLPKLIERVSALSRDKKILYKTECSIILGKRLPFLRGATALVIVMFTHITSILLTGSFSDLSIFAGVILIESILLALKLHFDIEVVKTVLLVIDEVIKKEDVR